MVMMMVMMMIVISLAYAGLFGFAVIYRLGEGSGMLLKVDDTKKNFSQFEHIQDV
jgi:hypothetical protein